MRHEVRLAALLEARRQERRYRTRRVIDSPSGPERVVDGRPCLTFCSNDYLGLANHPQVVAAFRRGADEYGCGSGAAHLICGHQRPHHALEEELAEFTGRSRALLFSTGYMANLGTISTLAQRGDVVFEDRLNHASLLDGGLLSGARLQRYRHNDALDLAGKLEASRADVRLVVTDGVFSMDGDIADLPALVQTTQAREACLMVDDAHGLGVLGERGGGVVEHFALSQQQVPVLMGTLGKALGSFGAFVAGSEVLIEGLIQSARSYIYTTAMPAANAEATRASLRIARAETWRREKLRALIAQFRAGAEQLGYQLLQSETPIQPILLGDCERANRLSVGLLEAGLLVSAIRPPTVPEGSARLRVTLSALHSEAQVNRLLAALEGLR